MTAALSVAGLAALFVAFGLLHRNGRPEAGCGACPEDSGGQHCASCRLVYDGMESTHERS